MSDVEITIRVPEELLKRVQAAGLHIEDLSSLIEAEMNRLEQRREPTIGSFVELAARIAALPDDIKPTPNDIEDEIRTVREEMAAERRTSKAK